MVKMDRIIRGIKEISEGDGIQAKSMKIPNIKKQIISNL
jgi:hypothetical protein